ncbi:AlpA family phage regulatory protein [Moraxella nasovis]|uniref:helix-turn-helix transcriptional regulator n=1 Tax=Moraxella nasovis TaxID=2904121 RepID=UPI001F615881|nr:AlpA family phage regulatory protein [Moraxella nasovis]UNU74059.1 AlpA family phage regulatory protein [Moraxella nasovis]
MQNLPKDGMSRINQILPFLPIGKSTVWKWVREGKFPEPVKLSSTMTAWRNSDIHAWIEAQGK